MYDLWQKQAQQLCAVFLRLSWARVRSGPRLFSVSARPLGLFSTAPSSNHHLALLVLRWLHYYVALVSILRLNHCVFKAANMYLNKVVPSKESVVADAVWVFLLNSLHTTCTHL